MDLFNWGHPASNFCANVTLDSHEKISRKFCSFFENLKLHAAQVRRLLSNKRHITTLLRVFTHVCTPPRRAARRGVRACTGRTDPPWFQGGTRIDRSSGCKARYSCTGTLQSKHRSVVFFIFKKLTENVATTSSSQPAAKTQTTRSEPFWNEGASRDEVTWGDCCVITYACSPPGNSRRSRACSDRISSPRCSARICIVRWARCIPRPRRHQRNRTFDIRSMIWSSRSLERK